MNRKAGKKAAKAKGYKGFGDTQPLKEPTPKKKFNSRGLLEQGQVRVSDVLILPSHEDLDDDLVSFITESFPLSGGGPFNPVIIRRVHEQEGGKEVAKIVLVSGAYRLEAAKLADLEYINCVFLEGDDNDAQLVQFAENIFRKELTALQHAEQLVVWVKLAEAKGFFSGQYVRKSKLGRPLGGLSKSARLLPAVGRSFEARRKIIQRATKIAGIFPEAKEAAKAAGLDDNQKALLQIAKAGGRKSQVRMVAKLAARAQDPNETKQDPSDSKHSTAASDRQANDAVRSSSYDDNETDTPKRISDTTIDALESMWKRHGNILWAHTPFAVRDQFLEMLRRARCKARADAVNLVKEVFQGREKVSPQKLYAYAKTKGLTKSVIRKALREWGYGRPKKGSRDAPWYYFNKDANYMNQLKIIEDDELQAALDAEIKHWNEAVANLPSAPEDEDYNYRI